MFAKVSYPTWLGIIVHYSWVDFEILDENTRLRILTALHNSALESTLESVAQPRRSFSWTFEPSFVWTPADR